MNENDNPAKQASTLILMRAHDLGVEIFMVERAKTMAFAGGMMAFPGGKVDEADAELAANTALASGFDGLDPIDAAARVAAIRETFEEAGVLVTDGPFVDEATRNHWRPRIVSHEEAFADFLTLTGHRLDAAKLTPWSHWCPPLGLEKRRYDTRFYLAAMPDGEDAIHDGSESVTSHWVRASDALARADAGDTSIIFPTRRNLERLAQHDSADALVRHAIDHPVTLVQPAIQQRDDGHYLCIPEGIGYPVTAEKLDRAMRG